MDLLERGTIIGGRYRMERVLARGGMGSVWVARHLLLDVDVAIKFIVPEHAADPNLRTRFQLEAKICAQLNNPHVAQMRDYGVEGDTPFLVMELLEGENLETRLEREKSLSLAATQAIASQICKALRPAQDLGLVHRDLKPANIFLALQNGEEVVKVLDFGIAKATGLGETGKVTKTDTLVGTPHYMSPEQVRGKHLDHRSDLWSVGVIVFRCLTGRLPFGSEQFGDVLVEICTGRVPAVSHIVPNLGPDVDQFIWRALRRDPQKRFQSADDFAEAFRAVAHSSGAMPGGTEADFARASGHSADATSLDAMGPPSSEFEITRTRLEAAQQALMVSSSAATLVRAESNWTLLRSRRVRSWLLVALGTSVLALVGITLMLFQTLKPEVVALPDDGAVQAPHLAPPPPSSAEPELSASSVVPAGRPPESPLASASEPRKPPPPPQGARRPNKRGKTTPNALDKM
jgi:eukaryotic-like serine/threonine-protein kinase